MDKYPVAVSIKLLFMPTSTPPSSKTPGFSRHVGGVFCFPQNQQLATPCGRLELDLSLSDLFTQRPCLSSPTSPEVLQNSVAPSPTFTPRAKITCWASYRVYKYLPLYLRYFCSHPSLLNLLQKLMRTPGCWWRALLSSKENIKRIMWKF
jgi:hypothetical protein